MLSKILSKEHASDMMDFRGMTTIASLKIEDIQNFEKLIIDSDLNQKDNLDEIGLEHKILNGMYCRKLFIPKGTFLTGKVHRNPYIDMCVTGDITVKSFLFDNTIENSRRFKDFTFLEGVPGRKRIGYAHQDTVWMTVDPVQTDNVDKAEDEVCCDNLPDYIKELPECQPQ